jgi:hypothetical protein
MNKVSFFEKTQESVSLSSPEDENTTSFQNLCFLII